MGMKIARFRTGRRVAYGVVKEKEVIEIRGGIYTKFRMTDARFPLDEVRLMPPTEATELWCPGLNFVDHLEFAGTVMGSETSSIPRHPNPWRKGRNSLTGNNEPIIIPKDSAGEVHYEGEVVAVIGKDCRRISPAQAPRFILGYTCGNDVSERTWQGEDWSFWRAKGSDTFAPVGPWIETEIDARNLDLVVRVNGDQVQHCNTRDMLFTFPEIVSYISQHVTLRPGDLVFSGTSGTTTAIKPGDVVEVEIPGIGVLSNPVEAEFDINAD
jgi:2-keto-4-pentenoate hydratase/2-oxohepta-3-ene-1,7-dioic acid hydratase in catechol pathway